MAGQKLVINANVEARMTDNGNNQYSYTYSVARPGKITISVLKYVGGRIYQEYYPSTNVALLSDYSSYSTDINKDWGTGVLYNGRYDNVGIKSYFKLIPPVTASYTFTVNVDDSFKLWINSNLIINKGCCGFSSVTISLTGGTFYEGYVEYYEAGGLAHMILYWQINGGGRVVVPSSAFYGPQYVSSPVTITIQCTNGESKVISGGRPVCQAVCGDGLRHSTEQ